MCGSLNSKTLAKAWCRPIEIRRRKSSNNIVVVRAKIRSSHSVTFSLSQILKRTWIASSLTSLCSVRLEMKTQTSYSRYLSGWLFTLRSAPTSTRGSSPPIFASSGSKHATSQQMMRARIWVLKTWNTMMTLILHWTLYIKTFDSIRRGSKMSLSCKILL